MDAPIPRKCPDCGKRGKVKRLVSLCAGRVELTGHELRQHLRAEGKKLAKEAQKSEDLAANIVGEEKYHKNELARTKQ